MHSRTKHIEIRHQFLREHIEIEIVKSNSLELKNNWLICLPNHLQEIDLITLELN